MTKPLPEEKWCGGCKLYHPLSNFHVSRNAVDGLQWRCKDCVRQYNREHRRPGAKKVASNKKLATFADLLQEDLAGKVNAGAQLTYALFHLPVEWWKQEQPWSLLRAYMNACAAYGIDDARRKAMSVDDDA